MQYGNTGTFGLGHDVVDRRQMSAWKRIIKVDDRFRRPPA
jgi:hypothetical protein